MKRSVRAAVVMPCAFGLTHLAFPDPQVSSSLRSARSRCSSSLTSRAGLARASSRTLRSFWWRVPRRAGHRGVGAQGRLHRRDGGRRLRRAVRRGRVAVGGDGLDGHPVDVRAARRGRCTESELGARLTGLGIAGALCIPACLLVWPPPWHDDLRRRLSASMTALGRLVAAHAEGARDPERAPPWPPSSHRCDGSSRRRHIRVRERRAGPSHSPRWRSRRVGGGQHSARARQAGPRE